jgi:hypothetical protein
MISEVLMAVKMWRLVFWVVMLCKLVGRYQRFGGTCRLLFQVSSEFLVKWIFYLEVGERIMLGELNARS